jgi:hypothetical protein
VADLSIGIAPLVELHAVAPRLNAAMTDTTARRQDGRPEDICPEEIRLEDICLEDARRRVADRSPAAIAVRYRHFVSGGFPDNGWCRVTVGP